MKRRLLSALLALVMTLTLLPVAAFATGGAEDAAGSGGQYAPAENQDSAPDAAPAKDGQADGPGDAAVMTAADEQTLLAAAAGGIAINKDNFPDDTFRYSFVTRFDTDGDNSLSVAEIAAVTSIDCSSCSIKTMTGIEHFTALKKLDCSGNNLTSLNVSNNTELRELYCQENRNLATLDVTKNTKLTDLNCDNVPLTTLDVSKNTALKKLFCLNTDLTTLDVSNNTALEELHCPSNPDLISLDVSQNTALKKLDCQGCRNLTTLDVSNNTQLTDLHCANTSLTSLDVSKNTQLKTLNCSHSQLTTLDVTQNTELEGLDCGSNQLTSLDVTKNTELIGLSCSDNKLTSLDVSQNTALTDLNCHNNALTTLDISRNTLLERLTCDQNQLISLDVSSNTLLNLLECSQNQLTSLDISKTKITDPEDKLYCDNNTYAIAVGNARTFDLSTLPGRFDVSKASSWNGGTVDGNILTVNDGTETVTYTYDCGKNASKTFTLTVTKRVDEQFTLTPGGRYYFDLSALGIPGTVNSNLPDAALHYVPFTYVGTVDAYKRTGAADKNTAAYEHSLFIADYAVTHTVSWNDLNAQGMIFGKTYTSGGIDYTLRAPSVGRDYTGGGETKRGAPINNEWDTIFDKAKQDRLDNTGGYIKNWKDILSFGQEGYGDINDNPAVRGYYTAFFYNYTGASSAKAGYGYRPVLELPTDLAADSLKVVELNTDGRMPGETYKSINIIVKKGESFTAPSAAGLPLSDNTSADTPMWWVDENRNFYKPGDTVPADVSALTAFYGGFGLLLDRGDGAVEVTPDNYTDIFGDGTASFVVPQGKNYGEIVESSRTSESDKLEMLATGKFEGNIFPNLKLKNADLTSVTLSERYIGQSSPFFITLDRKNTIGSLNGINRSLSVLSILGDGALTMNVTSRLSIYAQYGGNSVTVTGGLNIASALCIDSGSLTVTGDTQAVTLPSKSLGGWYLDDDIRLFLGSSANDTAEAALPQLSPEIQALYERYLAGDSSLTQDELEALDKALTKKWNDTLALFSGKTYVRFTNAWDVTYQPGTDGKGDVVKDVKFYRDGLTLRGNKLFTRSGYTQTGWATADGGAKVYAFGGSYTTDAALTLYPVWQRDTYAITYDLDGGTAAEGNPDTYTVETDAFTLKNPTRPGYTFTGWSGTGLTGESNLTVTIEKGSTGDRSYTAHWRFNPTSTGGGFGNSTSTIQATAGTGGTLSPSGDVSVRRGQDQTFTITPDKGYAIADVKVDGKSVGAVTSYTFRNVTAGHTIQVTFVKATASANTVDGSNLPLWSALLLMSTLSLAGAVLCQKKRVR